MNLSVGRWWRRRSLRARLTMVTTAGLALALLAGAVLLVGALHASLVRGLDSTAKQEATQTAALADAHRLPNLVAAAGGTVQVLDATGHVIASSPGADPLVPLLPAP